MSQSQSKAERRHEEAAFRTEILHLLEQQKKVIGALAQSVTHLQDQLDKLKTSRILQ